MIARAIPAREHRRVLSDLPAERLAGTEEHVRGDQGVKDVVRSRSGPVTTIVLVGTKLAGGPG